MAAVFLYLSGYQAISFGLKPMKCGDMGKQIPLDVRTNATKQVPFSESLHRYLIVLSISLIFSLISTYNCQQQQQQQQFVLRTKVHSLLTLQKVICLL